MVLIVLLVLPLPVLLAPDRDLHGHEDVRDEGEQRHGRELRRVKAHLVRVRVRARVRVRVRS